MERLIEEYAQRPLSVVGDTNIDLFQNSQFSELSNLFLNYDCHNCHNMITRPSSGTCIDQVFSNICGRVFVDSVECPLTNHNIICCKLRTNIISDRSIDIHKTHCDYNKVKECLQSNLSEIEIIDSSSELTDNLIHCINNAINDSTSSSKHKAQLRFELTPWINKNRQALILFKRKLLAKRRKSKKQNV